MLKRVFDILCSVLGLVLLSPVFVILVILVRFKLGSPVFFTQSRPGLYGKPFTMVKFRTMTDAMSSDGQLLPDSERITKFGAFLRSTSLDELPELWNVLKGEMSLVGPRPLLFEYLDYYTQEELKRHNVRPGITGLAQVSGRNNSTWTDRLTTDVWYVDNQSFLLDIKIILKTLDQVFNRKDVVVIPSTKYRKLSEERSRNEH